ncbi:cytochrome P450 [Boeremia exigua]|uniref:cytochrome P450 n=1 Tax=Boeremia exigua TaxID=749465 RepID=UPI001E8D801F|nr:cytochrome P450 [Boeremia exigua]KAH6629724.1 cytochrome P450 [Boeremia exigua]
MAYASYLAIAVALGLMLHQMYSAYKVRRQQRLLHIPNVKFDHDDTQAHYISNTREILHEGYIKYGKKGQAFRIRNPVDEGRPQVIMSKNYLDEVKNAGEDILSFPLYSIQSFLLKLSGSILPSAAATHISRIDLNKNLGEIAPAMKDECVETFKTVIPSCEDWTILKPWDTFLPTVARITGRILVGPDLCRNPEWIGLTIQNTQSIMKHAMGIRAIYPKMWQWLAPWTYPGRHELPALRKRAAELLEPVFLERLHAKSGSEKHRDAIQWLIDGSGGKPTTAKEVSDSLLFLFMAGIHSTSATIVSIVYDLIAHPEIIPELIQEIKSVQAESSVWNKSSLAKLRKMDSFMKESQRLHPAGLVTVQRASVRPHTFSDGLHVPANTLMMFPTYEFTHDPETYPDPEKFDPWRFYRMREVGDPNKFHFATVSNDSTNFGAGFHACPGRFFVGYELKIILSELLLNYDLKFAEGTERPQDGHHDFTIIPSTQTELLIRRKSSV